MIFLKNKKIVYEERYKLTVFDFDKYYYKHNEKLTLHSPLYNRELEIIPKKMMYEK